MVSDIQVVASHKAGLNSEESYIVVRGTTSFLRILGCDPKWELMTATADEDHGPIKVCKDQRRLVEAALRLGAELETSPTVETDWAGREYVKICGIAQEEEPTPEDSEQINRLFARYFELYDEYLAPGARACSEMRELYECLAVDDEGGDVYLSDGVWLSSDGSVHDRGR